MINIVLYEPEIPENTGNIMRTCAGTNSRLHLIEPLGFVLDEKRIKRSGVNYIDKVEYKRYLDYEDFTNNNKGEYYYVWAEKVGVGKMISNLYIAKMESGNQLKTVQVLLTTPDYDWERKGFWVNEGPAVIHHDGKMFLTYSASETGVDYCVGMLSIDEDADILDPRLWKKERYPVLKTCEKLGIYGPGHNSFTVDEDGNDVMVYHARTEAEINGDPLYNPNRHAMLMKVKWDEAGRPVFSYENK